MDEPRPFLREIELDFFLPTRSSYLHRTSLVREADGTWQPIIEAANLDMDRTIVQLANPPQKRNAGDWICAVAYKVGDVIEFGPSN